MISLYTKSFIIYVLFFQLFIFETEARGNIKKCLKKAGAFPIANSCTSYIVCKNWEIIREDTCNTGHHFNPIKGECDWAELYPCWEKLKSKHCPRLNGRFVKLESKCRKYYDCCDGEPTEKRCPSSTLFDAEKEKCEWKELVTCKEKPRRKECPKPNGRFVKPYSECRKYFECKNGEPQVMRCGTGLRFNVKTLKCEDKRRVSCKRKDNSEESSSEESDESGESSLESTISSISDKTTRTIRPNQKKCPKPNGKFVKPYSECRKYFECKNGQPYEKKCTRGFLFSSKTKKCERKKVVSCKQNDRSSESSSEESDESTSESTLTSDKLPNTFKPDISTFSDILSSSTTEGTLSSLQTTDLTSEEGSSSFGTTKSILEESTSNFQITDFTSVKSSSSFPTTDSTLEERTSSFPKTNSTLDGNSSSFPTDSTSEKISSSFPATDSTSKENLSSFSTSDSTTEENSSTFPTTYSTSEKVTSSYQTTDSTLKDVRSSYQTTDSTLKDVRSSYKTTDSTLEDVTSSYQTTDSTLKDVRSSYQTTDSTSNENTSSFPTSDSTSDEIISGGTSEDIDFQTKFSSISTKLTSLTTSSLQTKKTTKNVESFLSTESPPESSTSDPVKDFICPEATGYFPHPYDKHKFIGCVHFIPYEMTCPSDLIYNHKQRRCVYA